MQIDPTTQAKLIEAARSIRQRAYAPYSNFLVGAAILSKSGKIYTGVNVENASYGLTICAERSAVGTMIGAGETGIAAVAVATVSGVTPCGACRQVLREFGRDFPVWIIDESADEVRETTMADLLPDSFDSTQLP
ncbi:MAG: cytidine deaminase [Ardenticatenaceae bacterium]|nr:cytidine deaminase [Ardenticatenaceae bacterium]